MLTPRVLTRRNALLLPWLLAACGGDEAPRSYPPLRYDYLSPLRLNVSEIRIEQRFVASGAPPDVSQYAPVPPMQALRAMAEDRLQTLGSIGLAVFAIQDASLVRRRDTIQGHCAVELSIFLTPDARAGFAQASASATYTGDLDDLPRRLYDITRDMMEKMNVEFEYQVRRSLGPWLMPDGSVPQPVQQQPLTPPQGYPPPQPANPPPQGYVPQQQSYPPPQGYPAPQQAYPSPQGYPPPQSAYPSPQGYPQLQQPQGYPPLQQAYPPPQGYPAPEQAYPSPQGYPPPP